MSIGGLRLPVISLPMAPWRDWFDTRGKWQMNRNHTDPSTLSYPFLLPPSFSLPDVLCDPTDLIWKKRTPFEEMTGRTAPSSDGFLGFLGFSSAVRQMPGDLCTASGIISLSPLLLTTDVTDTRGKWSLARNPDRSWWHRHTSFWPQPPKAPWTTRLESSELNVYT